MNWATQIAARLDKSAASVISLVVPEVAQPPHAKPMTIAATAPPTAPHIAVCMVDLISGPISLSLSFKPEFPGWFLPSIKDNSTVEHRS